MSYRLLKLILLSEALFGPACDLKAQVLNNLHFSEQILLRLH